MSGAVNENQSTVQPRVLGNTEPIAFQLLDNLGAAINITGKTLQMRLIKLSDGTVKLSAGPCVIDTAVDGKGHYSPAAGDVDTEGEYAIYVIDATTTPNIRYPFDGAKWILDIFGEDETAD